MSNIDPKARTWAEIDMAALKHNFEIMFVKSIWRRSAITSV